jgi:prepilin-type N-terminal cleavage/methylation domain-containing protein
MIAAILRWRHTQRGYRAFTLIELLVVVAIIALLISILMPSLNAAKKEGRKVKCAANQRELLMATLIYANDARDFMPITNWGWPDNSTDLPLGWLYDPPELRRTGRGVLWKERDVESGMLWDISAKDRSLFRCPEHWKYGNYRNDTRRLTSYLVNGCISAFTRERTFKTTRYRVDAVVFWEPPDPEGLDEQSTGWIEEDWNDGSSTPDQGFSFRHGNNGVTLGVIDGHVEWWSLPKYLQTLENPYANALWCNPETDHGRWDGWTP